jgi:hypothetical protein
MNNIPPNTRPQYKGHCLAMVKRPARHIIIAVAIKKLFIVAQRLLNNLFQFISFPPYIENESM